MEQFSLHEQLPSIHEILNDQLLSYMSNFQQSFHAPYDPRGSSANTAGNKGSQNANNNNNMNNNNNSRNRPNNRYSSGDEDFRSNLKPNFSTRKNNTNNNNNNSN